jgi:hypothetical protein
MSTSIRDASLTTLKRKQRALAAYRSVSNFPNNNSVRPEQPNTQTADVPINARLGAALLGCCNTATDDGYGSNGNAYTRPYNF